MTERGLPLADGATACPFVAFEDDRDERASVPDHRHRCYAEQHPAPRALAHQEAYCLSSAFPVCPTFQDWARRESARARSEAAASRAAAVPPPDDPTPALAAGMLAAAAATGSGPADEDPGHDAASDATGSAPIEPTDDRADDGDADDPWSRPPDHDDEPVQRNPPRDWAAPPPWLASSEGGRMPSDAEPPSFLGQRPDPSAGLAGSAADQLAGGPPPARRPDSSADAWTAAAGVGAAGAAASASPGSATGGHADPPADDEYRVVDAPPGRVSRRPRAYDQHLGGPDGPDWERPRRHEAYPTIKARMGMPEVPRLVLLAGTVALLAVALFFLPGLLNLGGGGGSPAATASPSGGASPSLEPTPIPAATPIVYTIKKGDTLTKVAKANGLTLDELLAANPEIKNPNKVTQGQQIVIPVPSPSSPDGAAPSVAPSAASSAAT